MNQREIEAALNRRLGMSNEASKRLQEFNEAQHDWRGRCRKCGQELKGTLRELKGHTCNGHQS